MSTSNSLVGYASSENTREWSSDYVAHIIRMTFPDGATIDEVCGAYKKDYPEENRDISSVMVTMHIDGKLEIIGSRDAQSVYVLREPADRLEKLSRKLAREEERESEVQNKKAVLLGQLNKECQRLAKRGALPPNVDLVIAQFKAKYMQEKC